MALTILHEDAQWVAVNKPAGQIVIPGRGEADGLALNKELEARLGARVFVVHRLDRGASGIVLFAKTAQAHRHASMAFERREVHKLYRVAVLGVPAEEEGVIESPLREFGSGRIGVHPAGKPSTTAWRVMETFAGASLLEVFPHTGRRHQIRAHLYSMGHPVLGDTLYGKERPVGGAPRLMLHALSLNFEGLGRTPIALRAEPGIDFQAVLDTCRTRTI